MKRWSKKVWLSAVALVIAVMSVSAIPASADVSRVVYFSIPSNTVCGTNSGGILYHSLFHFTINNISNYSNNVTVNLYKNDGSQLTAVGGTSTGIVSDFTPGSPILLDPYASAHYYLSFGNVNKCEDRPAYGKIVVNGDSGLVMASGNWVGMKSINNTNSMPTTNLTMYSNSTILIHNGQPF